MHKMYTLLLLYEMLMCAGNKVEFKQEPVSSLIVIKNPLVLYRHLAVNVATAL